MLNENITAATLGSNLTMANMNNSTIHPNHQSHFGGKLDAHAQYTYVDTIGLLLLGVLICCIIGGNVLVISAFITVGRKIRTITNFFVVSLAVSDILVGVFSIPFWMMLQLSKSKFFIL